MKTLIVALVMAVSAPALAGEEEAPAAEGVVVTTPAEEVAAPVEAAAPAADQAQELAAEAAAPDPEPHAPQFRFVDVAVQLARALRSGAPPDLYGPVAPPAVVADGFGLLVQRRFGR